MSPLRTVVTFSATGFNTSEPRSHYLHPGNFGDDVAEWLRDRLRERSVEVEASPSQEDHGWRLTFSPEGIRHDLVVGYREEDWVAWIERSSGLLRRLLGGGKREVEPMAADAVHRVLATSDRISDLRWHCHADFLAGQEEDGADHPVEESP